MQNSGVAITSYGREATAMAARGRVTIGRGTCCDLRLMTGWWPRATAW